MSEIINARMQQKRGTSEEWANNPDFVPKDGELIVTRDGQGKIASIKIGDGSTSVSNLRAMAGEVYVQSEEPENAGEGAIWFDYETASKVVDVPDWEAKEKESGFIKNKPFKKIEYVLDNLKKIVFDPEEIYQEVIINDMNSYSVSDFHPQNDSINWENFHVVLGDGTKEKVRGYISSNQVFDDNAKPSGIYAVNGLVLGHASHTHFIIYLSEAEQIPYACFHGLSYLEGEPPKGTYFFINENKQPYISSLEFEYSAIEVQKKYQSIFRQSEEARVFRLNENIIVNFLNGLDKGEALDIALMEKALIAELSKFSKGDVVLVPQEILDMIPIGVNNK